MIDSSIYTNSSSNDALTHFKECLRLEVINRNGEKKFSWLKVLHRVIFSHKKRFYFWWRLANYLNQTPSKRNQKWARKINANLRCKYGVDISVEAKIGSGLKLNHYVGIIIRAECIIGKNANIRQNTTIGRKSSDGIIGMTVIGDNVDIGAHSCIIGDVRIGDNVTIGAMTFVNKDVPANSIIYNPVTAVIKSK